MLDQKVNQKGKKIISVKPATYDKLVELGKMGSSFDDVIMDIMEKAGILAITPELEKS